MVYILDTSSIRVFANYYPATFETFWEHLEELVNDGRAISVREVLKELEFQNPDAHLAAWNANHKAIFSPPTEEDMGHVAEIFAVEHFHQLIGETQRLRGQPVADPWIIARAMSLGAVVVTEETYRPNAARIPNVCEHFRVECIDLETMLSREGWKY